jgi:hypothetical protein
MGVTMCHRSSHSAIATTVPLLLSILLTHNSEARFEACADIILVVTLLLSGSQIDRVRKQPSAPLL